MSRLRVGGTLILPGVYWARNRGFGVLAYSRMLRIRKEVLHLVCSSHAKLGSIRTRPATTHHRFTNGVTISLAARAPVRHEARAKFDENGAVPLCCTSN